MGYDHDRELRDDLREGKIVFWTGFRLFLAAVVILTIVGGGLTWLVQGNEFFLYKYWAPKQEKVRREVFENTPSFVQGSIQDLQDLQRDYVKADAEHKKALASMIIHRSANVPEDRLPVDLRSFIWQLKKDAGLAQ